MSVDAIGDSVTLDSGFREEALSTWNGREVQASPLDDEALLVRAMALAYLGTQQEGIQAVRKLEQEIYALDSLDIGEEASGGGVDDPEVDAILAFIASTASWTSPELAKAEERIKLLLNDPTRPRNPLYLNGWVSRAAHKVTKVVREAGRDVRHFCDKNKKPLIVAATVAVAVTTIILTDGAATPQALGAIAAATKTPSGRDREEEKKHAPSQGVSSPPPPPQVPNPSYVIPSTIVPDFRSGGTSLPTAPSALSAQPKPLTFPFQSTPKPTETPPFSVTSPASSIPTYPSFRAKELHLPTSALPASPAPVAHQELPPSSLIQVGLAEIPSCTAPPLPLPSPSFTSSGLRASDLPLTTPLVSPYSPPPPSSAETAPFKSWPVGVLPIESPWAPFLPDAGQLPPPPERFVPPNSPFPGGLPLVADRVLPIPPPPTPSRPLPVIPPADQPKKNAEPKTVGFFDPDAPPRVYSLEPPPPPTPKVFEIPGKTLARGAIGGINGMGNNFAQATANAEYIAKLSGEHQIQWVHNKSHTIPVDCLETIFVNSIGHSAPAQDLIDSWMAFHKKHKNDPGAKYFQICHSQGAFHVLNALFKAPKEIRDRIIVLAIAPAVVIPKALCFDSFNYASKRDIIPDLGAMTQYNSDGPYQEYIGDAAIGDMRELIFLDPHPDAPLFDHGLDSPTFKEKAVEHLTNYIQKYGWAQ